MCACFIERALGLGELSAQTFHGRTSCLELAARRLEAALHLPALREAARVLLGDAALFLEPPLLFGAALLLEPPALFRPAFFRAALLLEALLFEPAALFRSALLL